MSKLPALTTPVTMSSLELVEYINLTRKEGEPVLLHKNFMAKVPEVLGGGQLFFQHTYTNKQNGQTYDCYNFPKREACLMAMSYSYELQAKVFDRMTELENPKVNPQTLITKAFRPAIHLYKACLRAASEALKSEHGIDASAELEAALKLANPRTALTQMKELEALKTKLLTYKPSKILPNEAEKAAKAAERAAKAAKIKADNDRYKANSVEYKRQKQELKLVDLEIKRREQELRKEELNIKRQASKDYADKVNTAFESFKRPH